MHLQQPLVNAAKLLGAKVLVIHRPADVAILDESERMNGLEEVAIGN